MSREEENGEARKHFPSRRADKNSVAEPSQRQDSANLDSYWEGSRLRLLLPGQPLPGVVRGGKPAVKNVLLRQ